MLKYLTPCMRKIWIPFLLLVLLSSCSLFRARVEPYPEGIIFPLTPAHTLDYEGEVRESLLLRDGRLYLATHEGHVYAVDAGEPKIEWEFQMRAAGAGPVSLGEEHVYSRDMEGRVYCLDAEGNSLWEVSLSEPSSAGMCEGDGHLYLATEAGKLLALNLDTGGPAWSFQAEDGIQCEPACGPGIVAFGCEDGNVYVLRTDGSPVGRIPTEGPVRGGLLINGDRLYFGSSDHFLYCVSLPDLKMRWKVRTGGPVEARPVMDGGRVYVVSRNNVLYCLARRSGTVLWWKHVPARSRFRPEIIDDRITAASLSTRLVCFDVQNGESRGTYEAPVELRANPVWSAPHLILAHYDRETGLGRLSFLKKEVKATIVFSKTSPQPPNEEIQVKAEATGFYKPQYTFFLTRYLMLNYGLYFYLPALEGEERQLVQDRSEAATWDWFPEELGVYIVEVDVEDEKETASSAAAFPIEKGGSNAAR